MRLNMQTDYFIVSENFNTLHLFLTVALFHMCLTFMKPKIIFQHNCICTGNQQGEIWFKFYICVSTCVGVCLLYYFPCICILLHVLVFLGYVAQYVFEFVCARTINASIFKAYMIPITPQCNHKPLTRVEGVIFFIATAIFKS